MICKRVSLGAQNLYNPIMRATFHPSRLFSCESTVPQLFLPVISSHFHLLSWHRIPFGGCRSELFTIHSWGGRERPRSSRRPRSKILANFRHGRPHWHSRNLVARTHSTRRNVCGLFGKRGTNDGCSGNKWQTFGPQSSWGRRREQIWNACFASSKFIIALAVSLPRTFQRTRVYFLAPPLPETAPLTFRISVMCARVRKVRF